MEKVNAGTHTVRAWLLTGVDLSLHLQGLSIAVLWIQIVQILSAVRLLLPAGWALPLFELLEGSAIFFVNHRDNRLAKALTSESLEAQLDVQKNVCVRLPSASDWLPSCSVYLLARRSVFLLARRSV